MDIDKYYITYTTTTNSTPVSTTVTKTKSGSYYDPIGDDLKNWMSEKNLKTLKIESTNTLLSAENLFRGMAALTELDLSNFDTSNVGYMFSMFADCSSLTSLDLSNFDTSNVGYMDAMFGGCSSLTSLDLSNFDTSNVGYMDAMFGGCVALTSLDVSNFDTSNVIDMEDMFDNCRALIRLYLGTFNVSNTLNTYSDIFTNTNNCQIYFTESEAIISTRKGYPWDVSTSRFVFNYVPPIPGAGYDLKVRVGSSWVKKNYKIWDGTKWNEEFPLKIRHDDEWIDVSNNFQLSNIEEGDNLNAKTLKFTYDDEFEPFYWFAWQDNPAVIKCGENNYIEFWQTAFNGIDGYVRIIYQNEVLKTIWGFEYPHGGYTLNSYTLPADFGTVTSIETDDPSYEFIKIYK